jgi:hypothetical protein
MTTRVFIGLLFAAGCVFTISAQIIGEGRSLHAVHVGNDLNSISIQGQVSSAASDVLFSELTAELCDTGDMNRVVDRSSVNGTGEFSFVAVPQGIYSVRIAARTGAILGESIAGASGMVRIEIHSASKPNPLAGSVISLAELKHKVPRNALKEAEQANKALKKRDMKSLILHLQKAIALDPGFVAARRNLANAFLTTHQYVYAADAYRELLALDAHSVVGYMGLSTAYMSIQKVREAEEPARKAVELDNGSELAHYLLGCSLAAQGKDFREALSHLGKAFKTFPAAHLIAARILALEGRKDEAKARIQEYLDTGDTYARTQAEQLLNTLY